MSLDKILFEIKDQIYLTIILAKDFFKTVNISTVLMSLGLVYVVVLRKWPIPKLLSFFLFLGLLFVALIRVEALFLTTFGVEGSKVSIGISRFVFLIIAAVVLIYNALIKE